MATDAHNASSLIGRTIGGRYTIKATIGSGGMGHVYRATQAPINREVAIKVLRVDLAHQEGVAERFKREAKAATLIQHPNAITIFDFDQDGEILFLAMELLSGETLRQRMRREPVLEVNEALDMFESMAGALGAAHRVGVVHRDLKPDNIFLAKFDAIGQVVKVLDFGLAKLLDRAADNDGLMTEPNLRLGTPRYMAPEQALGIQPIDSRCDVYALGLLLFEMLAQRAPFTGEDGMEVLAQRLRREAPRLSQIAPQKNFSEEMDDLLATMLKRDREHRPQDANVVLGRIREIRKNNQVTRAPIDNNETLVSGETGRSGAFARPSTPPYGAQAASMNRGRPGTDSAPNRVGANRAEAMVRLDQDDFPEKPTVVVDPGIIEAQALQNSGQAVRPSNPVVMPAPEPQHPMQMYSSSPAVSTSAPAIGQPMAVSISAPQLPPKRKAMPLVVIVVIAVAVLAPVLALLFVRFSKGGDDRPDPPSAAEEVRTRPPSSPPPPVQPETKPAELEPATESGAPEKGSGKKSGGKKRHAEAAKPKADSKRPVY